MAFVFVNKEKYGIQSSGTAPLVLGGQLFPGSCRASAKPGAHLK